MTLASEYNTKYTQASIQPFFMVRPNRLSSTIGGNREMDQLYTTSQVSNITRKTKFSHIILDMFSKIK